ncbi:MAG: hypothetical protein QS748_14380 [Candidatus Endonucleobacter bathymodioli]|uniref:Uncharacterized protein n=1 Tax=Candidatus Endonucleibacter bathymodioli TaxID=539814 RepID=A0AA90NY40_9GAMM|nr:hypothetical protein [Candidatus Endonucleobacter bathymodioli]MDP0590303.1 hypothetical protein [Candidatus Endonucleobacter bathymodioli]
MRNKRKKGWRENVQTGSKPLIIDNNEGLIECSTRLPTEAVGKQESRKYARQSTGGCR